MDRLIDRVDKEDWVNLTTDMEKVVAKKITNKIDSYVDKIKESGNIPEFIPTKE